MSSSQKSLKPGDEVLIRCEAKNGQFDDEMAVTINTLDGIISGFVQKSVIEEHADGVALIRGRVISLDHNSVTVLVKGEFFTSNGLARILDRDVNPSRAA